MNLTRAVTSFVNRKKNSALDFNKRFGRVVSYTDLLASPFFSNVEKAPNNLQQEPLDWQSNNSELKQKFISLKRVEFSGSLSAMFPPTYICEQRFSRMKRYTSEIWVRKTDM
jgi:hypothetical protein